MIDIEKIVDNPDGSATITVIMSQEELMNFAKTAIRDTLVSVSRSEVLRNLTKMSEDLKLYPDPEDDYHGDPINDRDDIECRSRNPAKICANCTCWKNQNE